MNYNIKIYNTLWKLVSWSPDGYRDGGISFLFLLFGVDSSIVI